MAISLDASAAAASDRAVSSPATAAMPPTPSSRPSALPPSTLTATSTSAFAPSARRWRCRRPRPSRAPRLRIETGGVLSGLPVDARRTEAVYLRLAPPAAFAGQYRRLLYLDSDVFHKAATGKRSSGSI